MCFSVLAHDAASPWAERSKQITTITSDWSLILHHGLLFIYREKCKEHFTHPILPDALIYFIILLLFPFASVTVDILFFGSVMISFCISATSWTRYWFMYFLPFLYQIVYSTLVLIWFVYICCTVFLFFFVIDVDKTRPTCQQSYSTSETNVGDTVVTGERHTAECCQINKSTAWFIQQHVNELNWTVVDQTDHLSTRCRIVSSWREGLQLSFCWSDICIFVMCESDTWLYRCFFGFFCFFLHSGYFLLKYRLRLAAVL